MIECRDLRKSFGKVEAVKGVTFSVREGEYFGLLGPNGAGKSTTIRILTTLVVPTAGEARVGGHDVLSEAHRVRELIGLVSDKMLMYPQLTARENLRFFGRLYHIERGLLEERIDELLEVTRMTKWGDNKFGTFSTGMKQRLNVARALVTDPKVLFLDEPTLGLDPQSTREIRDLTRLLNKERGTTIVLTTHQMSEADLLCDRIAVVDHGQVVACDTSRALKDRVSGGGRRVVEVTLREGADATADALRNAGLADGVEVTERDLRILTTSDLEPVLDVVREHGHGLLSVRTNEPTLEDVFLHLTGREMRDSPSKKPVKLPLVARALVKWKLRKAAKKNPDAANAAALLAATRNGGGRK